MPFFRCTPPEHLKYGIISLYQIGSADRWHIYHREHAGQLQPDIAPGRRRRCGRPDICLRRQFHIITAVSQPDCT